MSSEQISNTYAGTETNTARILYGMPAFDDDLQSKLDSGKVVLGGCLIQIIEKDGQTIIVNPDRK